MPEASQKLGFINTTKKNPNSKHWYAILDFTIGSDKTKGLVNQIGGKLFMMYLRSFDPEDPYLSQMGYSKEYGVGIMIDSVVKEDGKRYSRVSNYYSPEIAVEQTEHAGHQMCHRPYEGDNYAI